MAQAQLHRFLRRAAASNAQPAVRNVSSPARRGSSSPAASFSIGAAGTPSLDGGSQVAAPAPQQPVHRSLSSTTTISVRRWSHSSPVAGSAVFIVARTSITNTSVPLARSRSAKRSDFGQRDDGSASRWPRRPPRAQRRCAGAGDSPADAHLSDSRAPHMIVAARHRAGVAGADDRSQDHLDVDLRHLRAPKHWSTSRPTMSPRRSPPSVRLGSATASR